MYLELVAAVAEDENKSRQVHLTFEVGGQRGKALPETIAFTDKRESLLIIQIQEELKRKSNNPKPHLAAAKSVKFQERLKKMPLYQRTNPADQKQNPQKINLHVMNKRQKSYLRNQNLEPSRKKNFSEVAAVF